MPIETTKYTTKSGAVYFQTINSENDKVISKSWKREAKRQWDSNIDMAAYISPKMKEDLEMEYDFVCGDNNEKDKRDDLEDIIAKAGSEDYKGEGGHIVSLTSNNNVAFSKPVIKIEKVK